jgi:tripartite-type tricarboxylate transporter receptor subunit TctC
MITRRTLLATAGASLSSFGTASLAQGTRPLTIVIGFPAGVITDNIARLLATKLGRYYPAGVLVDNRVGAGGRIAADYVKRASEDGHTVLIGGGSGMWIYPHVFKKLSYDPLTDFRHVAGIASLDYAITVGPLVPASVKTLQDYVQWCRGDAVRARYGIPAAGSTSHFIGTLLARETGVPFEAVAYKGGAPALQDVVGGHIPAIIDPFSNALQYHQQGRLRVLAITGSQRSPALPDVPTVIEAGLPKLVAKELFSVYAPARVPMARVQKLHDEFAYAVSSSTDGLAKLIVSPEAIGTAELEKMTREELQRWKSIVEASGFKAEE